MLWEVPQDFSQIKLPKGTYTKSPGKQYAIRNDLTSLKGLSSCKSRRAQLASWQVMIVFRVSDFSSRLYILSLTLWHSIIEKNLAGNLKHMHSVCTKRSSSSWPGLMFADARSKSGPSINILKLGQANAASSKTSATASNRLPSTWYITHPNPPGMTPL